MRRLYLPLATIILVVVAFLRFWQLDLYPPGPHYDEGAYLLITRSIAFGGARFFPIVEAYQGREVLYMYLNAPLLHLIGNSILTLHITSAILNLVTLAASMTLARRMFPGDRGIIIALAVGVIFLLSFPQLFIARQAFRAITLPFMQVLALLFLWHGLRHQGRWGWLALGGLFAGGAVYTYMASRLFPFWLALAALVLLWSDRVQWRMRLAQGVVFFGMLALAATPMAIYALEKPDIFWGRLGEVTQTGTAISLQESIVLHLRMFFLDGDPYFRYNIAGRPYFTLPEGILLVIGSGASIGGLLRRRAPALEKPAYMLALLAPLMVIPSVISTGGLPPSHMRSLGMIPLIFITVAIGFEALYRWAAKKWNFNSARILPAIVLVFALPGGAWIGQAYFAWASSAALFYETDADLSAAARWLGDHAQAGEHIYLAARDRSHPTVLVEQTPPITWVGTNTLFLPPSGEQGLYIFPRSAPPSPDWAAWLEPGRIHDLPMGPDGRTAFEAFRLNGDYPLPPSVHPDEPIENPYLSLIGTYATNDIAAGTRGEIAALWRVKMAPTDSDLTPLIQLTTPDGLVLSRSDVYMTDTNTWQPGATFMVRLPIDAPLYTPPGDYPVEVAWVARARDQYVPYQSAEGLQAGIWSRVGSTAITRPSQPPHPDSVPVQTRLDREIAPGIALLGYDLLTPRLRPGESVSIRLFWHITQDIARQAPYRLLLMGDEQITLHESVALPECTEISCWRLGDVLREDRRLPLPRDLESDIYALLLQTGNVVVPLGDVQVEGIARVFDAPPVEVTPSAVFGELIRLHGYTVETHESGFELTLVWRAETVIPTAYTVFVHLVDTEGAIVEQRDAMPMQNSYPTTLWQAGEYVVDRYAFDIPMTRDYEIRVGLYDSTTGMRLRLPSPGTTDEVDYLTITP